MISAESLRYLLSPTANVDTRTSRLYHALARLADIAPKLRARLEKDSWEDHSIGVFRASFEKSPIVWHALHSRVPGLQPGYLGELLRKYVPSSMPGVVDRACEQEFGVRGLKERSHRLRSMQLFSAAGLFLNEDGRALAERERPLCSRRSAGFDWAELLYVWDTVEEDPAASLAAAPFTKLVGHFVGLWPKEPVILRVLELLQIRAPAVASRGAAAAPAHRDLGGHAGGRADFGAVLETLALLLFRPLPVLVKLMLLEFAPTTALGVRINSHVSAPAEEGIDPAALAAALHAFTMRTDAGREAAHRALQLCKEADLAGRRVALSDLSDWVRAFADAMAILALVRPQPGSAYAFLSTAYHATQVFPPIPSSVLHSMHPGTGRAARGVGRASFLQARRRYQSVSSQPSRKCGARRRCLDPRAGRTRMARRQSLDCARRSERLPSGATTEW